MNDTRHPPAPTADSPSAGHLTLLFLASALAGLSPDATPAQSKELEPVPVFWLIGQSNANGATAGFWLANELIAENKFSRLANQPDVMIWWPGKSALRPDSAPAWESFRTGSPEKVNNSTYHLTEGAFGPEASIGDAAREHFGGRVYLFKYTVVSALDPKDDDSWSKGRGSKGLYHDVLAEWQRAVDSLAEQGLLAEVRGVFFSHGESDIQMHRAPHYGDRLRKLLKDVRKDLAAVKPDKKARGRAKLPRRRGKPQPILVVLGQLHDRHVPRDAWEKGEALIRQAQASIAADDPHTGLTLTHDYALVDEASRVHFDAVGTVRYGYELFETWRQLDAELAEKKPRGRSKPEVEHVDAAGAAKLLAEDETIVPLDVRTPGEFGAGHIEGAVLVDFMADGFADKLKEYDPTRRYLVYCASGGRSTKSLEALQKQGFDRLVHLDGGMQGWAAQKLPTVTPK